MGAAARNKKGATTTNNNNNQQRSGTGSGSNSNPQQHHLQTTHSSKTQQDSFSANNDAILKQDQFYQSPKDREGDYSYAYDSAISPAVVIKWNEEHDDDESDFEIEDAESTESDDMSSSAITPSENHVKMPPSRCQQQTPSQKCKQKKKLVKKSKSVSATNKDAENIYEEIEDVKAQSASSSVNNSDSGIGGLTGHGNATTKSLNSYGSSSASKSSSGGPT